jgi:hypothetical protein
MTKQILKLTAETLQILKVMQNVNNSMAFKAGNELKTISASGSIIMESVIGETFPQDFNIYELSKFLGVLNLPNFKEAELHFEDGENFMTIVSGSAKIKYFYSPEAFVTHPGKKINLPKIDVTVNMTKETLDNFEKAASALGHKVIQFKVEDKQLYLIATTEAVDTSNDYVVELGAVDAEDFEAKILLSNLKLMPGDYTIELVKTATKGISRWEHTTRKIVTFIGLEAK